MTTDHDDTAAREAADCAETLRELQTFLDHELSADTVTHIRVHLDGCVDCQQAYEFHAELRMVVRSKCLSDELPDGLADRLRSCLGDDVLDPSPDA